MYTRGYTGAKRQNQRETFVYIEDDVRTATARIRSLTANICGMPAFDFTQLVRGELFVLADSLLTSNFQMKFEQSVSVPDAELQIILDFCDHYCQLYCKWLAALPDLCGAYLESQQHRNLYLISPTAAVANAGPEFTKTLKLFFGYSERTKPAFSVILLDAIAAVEIRRTIQRPWHVQLRRT